MRTYAEINKLIDDTNDRMAAFSKQLQRETKELNELMAKNHGVGNQVFAELDKILARG